MLVDYGLNNPINSHVGLEAAMFYFLRSCVPTQPQVEAGLARSLAKIGRNASTGVRDITLAKANSDL